MNTFFAKKMEGFTLIELMIVVAIVGILASIAVSNFMNYQCKSKTSEARINLEAVFTAEEAYLTSNDKLATLEELGWIPIRGVARYAYSVVIKSSSQLYRAVASTDGTLLENMYKADTARPISSNGKDDIWVMDQARVFYHDGTDPPLIGGNNGSWGDRPEERSQNACENN